MPHLIDKDRVVAEIEKLISNGKFQCQQSQEYNDQESYIAWYEHIATCEKILSFINTLEVKEEEEETESIWHDANQQPTMYRKYLVRYSDGIVSGSWERHDDGFISWEDEAKEHGSFTHWCYVKDLLKL